MIRRVGILACALVAAGFALAGPAWAHDPAPPDAPTQLGLDDARPSMTLSWAPSGEHGSPVTDYRIEVSTDGDKTWTAIPAATTTETSAILDAPPTGKFYFYRVIADSTAGPSEPSSEIGTLTPGTSTQRFIIRTASGESLTNGQVQWSDGNGPPATSWSASYPREWSVRFGTDPQRLTVEDPPPMQSQKVTVLMTNGVPVVGAHVDLLSTDGLVSSVTRHGFVYADPGAVLLADTDGSGVATVHGWSAEGVQFVPPPPPEDRWPNQQVYVDYNDGKLHQDGSFTMTGDQTTVTLDPMPWLTTPSTDPTQAGDLTALVFTVHGAPGSARAAKAGGGTSLAGVSVTVQPPKGWSAKSCGPRSVLTGKTDATGKVHLKVCGSRSGIAKVITAGAVPTGAITLRVRHAAPLPPARATAASTARGQLAVSWAKPHYTGGTPLTGYELVASAHGQKSRTVKVGASQTDYTFRHLARALRWKVSVQATNRYGTSNAVADDARVI
jgi:hypothetical protein